LKLGIKIETYLGFFQKASSQKDDGQEKMLQNPVWQ
jgi:hypothetical protein